jgi:hypothetical protein
MSVEEIRQVLEGELGPELREMRRILSKMMRRLDFKEEIDRIRVDTALQRLEFIQQSRTLERRISALVAAKGVMHDVRAKHSGVAENAL